MPAREMSYKIDLDDYGPTMEDIEEVWVHAVDGEMEDDVTHKEALVMIWPMYNRGSGKALMDKMDEAEMPSLSVNDVVVIEDTAYLCEPYGWSEIQ